VNKGKRCRSLLVRATAFLQSKILQILQQCGRPRVPRWNGILHAPPALSALVRTAVSQGAQTMFEDDAFASSSLKALYKRYARGRISPQARAAPGIVISAYEVRLRRDDGSEKCFGHSAAA
jgi:hypothetical protein